MGEPIFVPVAFSEIEALALLGAARSVFGSGVALGAAEHPNMAPLAQAMVRLAEATDKARPPVSEDNPVERGGTTK